MVREHVDAQTCDLAVLGRRNLGCHVIVAGERRGGEIFHPVLDPLDRPSCDDRRDDRADVPGVDADLVAEAAADVGRYNVNLVLRNRRQQGRNSANDVRGLECAPDGQLALNFVE